jgi:hypothetical protein
VTGLSSRSASSSAMTTRAASRSVCVDAALCRTSGTTSTCAAAGTATCSVYGYNYVPPTPFQLKDWERYDVSRYVEPGCVSPEEGRRSVTVDAMETRYATIQQDLVALDGRCRPLAGRHALSCTAVQHRPRSGGIGRTLPSITSRWMCMWAVSRFGNSFSHAAPRVTLHGTYP